GLELRARAPAARISVSTGVRANAPRRRRPRRDVRPHRQRRPVARARGTQPMSQDAIRKNLEKGTFARALDAGALAKATASWDPGLARDARLLVPVDVRA